MIARLRLNQKSERIGVRRPFCGVNISVGLEMAWFSTQRRWLKAYRDPGWFVERDGKRVGLLTNPEMHDMFWLWWKVEPFTDAPPEPADLLNPEFWAYERLPSTQFLSRAFGTNAHAFWSGTVQTDGRILMRGLYEDEPVGLWNRFVVRCLMLIGY